MLLSCLAAPVLLARLHSTRVKKCWSAERYRFQRRGGAEEAREDTHTHTLRQRPVKSDFRSAVEQQRPPQLHCDDWLLLI